MFYRIEKEAIVASSRYHLTIFLETEENFEEHVSVADVSVEIKTTPLLGPSPELPAWSFLQLLLS
jgi:hypothetical protein